MSIAEQSIKDREFGKFRDRSDGPAVAVVTGGIISDVDYDYYTRVLSGADNEIETWTYRNGGSGGVVVAVVVATYTDSYRDDLVTVERTI